MAPMRVFHSDDHRLHAPSGELHGGRLVPPFETPRRVDMILARLAERGFSDVVAPGPPDMAAIEALCDPGYLAFLRTAWADWRAAGFQGDVIAASYPARRMQQARPPREIDGRVGYYALASETAIAEGTWTAALASAACAQSAATYVAAGSSAAGPSAGGGGARAAFALCRPPGHHATADMFGGYCFLNNAALAAEALRASGAARVAVLDVDFHHGNGTQDIFWERGDVLFASIHGDPLDAFPYFLGHADERGAGAGEGATLNHPLPPGTGYAAWAEALDDALARVRAFGAEALVVSLGVDAFREDPISFFRLESDDFADMGRRIGRLGLPTVLCLEGGYAVEAVGVNVVNALEGIADA